MAFTDPFQGGSEIPAAGSRGFFGNVSREMRAIGAAVPRLPSLAIKEALGLPAPQVESVRTTLKSLRIPYLSRLAKESERDTAQKTQALSRAITSRDPGKIVSAASELPGVRLVPGTYVTGQLARGRAGVQQLKETPVSTLLDLAPALGKGVRIATRGTGIAREAAAEAARLGRPAAEARMLERGLEPRQAAMQLGRRAERAITARAPGLEPFTPSRLLERTGAGGAQTRALATKVQVTQRRLAGEFDQFTRGATKRARDLKLTPEDVTRLTRIWEEGAPGWRDRLTDTEAAYTRWYEEATDQFRRRGLESGDLIVWKGETYSRADNPRLFQTVREYERNTGIGNRRVTGELTGRRYRIPGETYMQRARDAAAKADELAGATPPARFRSVLQPRIRDSVARKLGRELTDADWTALVEDVSPLMPKSKLARIAGEVSRGWQDLKAAGHDPVFVHHVTPDAAQRLRRPSVLAPIKAESAYKRRGWDLRPWVANAQVGLTGQALEAMQRQYGRALVDELTRARFMRSKADLAAELLPRAQRLATESGRSVREAYDLLLRRDFEVVNLESIFPVRVAGIGAAGDLYMPKGLARALKKARPPDFPELVKLWDRQLNLFRLSVLSLNPMYYVNNVLSGAILLGARQPRAFRQFLPAWRALKDGTLPAEISRGLRIGTDEMATAVYHYAGGRTIGRILEGIPAGRGRIRDAAGRTVNALQNTANVIDDMYKAMSYFDGYERALKKGTDATVARAAGEEAANRVLINFDTMTNLERTVIRRIIPFYSWSRFILGYAFSYPFDHPWRAAIVSSLARNEFDDWNSGLPERFQTYFFLGQPDATGRQVVQPIGGIFPFADVANYFTTAGIISRIDPRFTVLLSQLGVDEITANAELYPTLNFDPVSGRESVQRPPLVRGIVGALVPQAGSVLELLSTSQEMRELRQRDPEAFTRRILGDLGVRLPIGAAARRVSIPEEIEKAQRAAQRVERERAREAARQQMAGAGTGGGFVDPFGS